MICRPAEASFQKGQKALSEGRLLEAQALFEASLKLSKELGEGPIQPRYLSYYGLCLSRQKGLLAEAKEICERAAESEPYNAELWLNLARVSMARGDRANVHRAVVSGLAVAPTHPGLIDHLKRIGVRRRPLLPFLPRGHGLNRLAGRLVRWLS